MYTSYSIEKIADSNRREALAAAEARRLARAFRRTVTAESQQESPSAGTIRIPRQRRWFGVVVAESVSGDDVASSSPSRPRPRRATILSWHPHGSSAGTRTSRPSATRS